MNNWSRNSALEAPQSPRLPHGFFAGRIPSGVQTFCVPRLPCHSSTRYCPRALRSTRQAWQIRWPSAMRCCRAPLPQSSHVSLSRPRCVPSYTVHVQSHFGHRTVKGPLSTGPSNRRLHPGQAMTSVKSGDARAAGVSGGCGTLQLPCNEGRKYCLALTSSTQPRRSTYRCCSQWPFG